MFIEVPVDGAELKLSDGMSSSCSFAVQPNNGFLSFTCLAAKTSTCCLLCSPFSSVGRPYFYSRILKFLGSLFSVFLCSRSISRSGIQCFSCQKCSLSSIICHSLSLTKSLMLAKSARTSTGFILSIKKSSTHLLYLMLVLLRPPLLVSMSWPCLVLSTVAPRSAQAHPNLLLQKSLSPSGLLSFHCHPCS